MKIPNINKMPITDISNQRKYKEMLKERNAHKSINHRRNKEMKRNYQSTHDGRNPKIINGHIVEEK